MHGGRTPWACVQHVADACRTNMADGVVQCNSCVHWSSKCLSFYFRAQFKARMHVLLGMRISGAMASNTVSARAFAGALHCAHPPSHDMRASLINTGGMPAVALQSVRWAHSPHSVCVGRTSPSSSIPAPCAFRPVAFARCGLVARGELGGVGFCMRFDMRKQRRGSCVCACQSVCALAAAATCADHRPQMTQCRPGATAPPPPPPPPRVSGTSVSSVTSALVAPAPLPLPLPRRTDRSTLYS